MDKTSEILYALLEYVQSFPIEQASDTFPDINLVTQRIIDKHYYVYSRNYGTPFYTLDGAICIGAFTCETYVESIILRCDEIFKMLADKASREKSPIMYPLKNFIYGGAEKNTSWQQISKFTRDLYNTYHNLVMRTGYENFNSIDRVLKFDEKLVLNPCHAEIIRYLFCKDEMFPNDIGLQTFIWK